MSNDPHPYPLAEATTMVERIIVAPVGGVLRLHAPGTVTADGEVVSCGQVIGSIERLAGDVDVVSTHAGMVMGRLALSGERVRHHQPVAWLVPFQT